MKGEYMKEAKQVGIVFLILSILSINILFHGYPSEIISIGTGVICSIIAFSMVRKELQNEKNN